MVQSASKSTCQPIKKLDQRSFRVASKRETSATKKVPAEASKASEAAHVAELVEVLAPAADRPDEGAAVVESAFKDELNLAEFPIAALADRVPDGQTTLVFEDRLERRDEPPIVRRLTIMGTAKHGLPTSVDDEVLVGLIQLTKRWNNFNDARVAFSRYELIELLGWPQTGQSYRRIEEALHRWVGVVLSYENAWWDNAAKSWVDENFHVLDNVTIYDRERRKPAKGARRRRRVGGGDPAALSSFKWNEVIFRSFQSGNLKQIDLDFYLTLSLPTTKRIFRFLDKRFYRRERIDFDLKTFACEHIGLSRAYKPTELKRRLRPALEELERLGFLQPLAESDRYAWQGRGQWRIVFARGPWGRSPENETAELTEALGLRGVDARTSAELIATYPAERIQAKLDVFDWLVQKEDKRVGKNPAGYLVSSIKGDYQAPPEYRPPAEAERLAGLEFAAAEAEQGRRRHAKAEAEAAAKREAEIRKRWDALKESEREAIAAKVKSDNPGLRRWKSMLEPLCLAAFEAKLVADGAIPPAPTKATQGTLF
jgi:Replication initiator protein A